MRAPARGRVRARRVLAWGVRSWGVGGCCLRHERASPARSALTMAKTSKANVTERVATAFEAAFAHDW
eukprot:1036207-Pleurochrysis_carterae.AAC.2